MFNIIRVQLTVQDIFFCRQLPSNYVTEYIMEQEHLSFIRFFHHAVVHQSIDPLQISTNRKWCVFTRTSGELLRLCSDEKLQRLFVPTFTKMSGLSIDFCELSSVQSLENCRLLIEQLAKTTQAISANHLSIQHIFLLYRLADMCCQHERMHSFSSECVPALHLNIYSY